ncbi:Os05g0585601, partial [Oryza sativa Japonica Group]
TGLEEDGEAKIGGFERGVLALVEEEEVLGLEVPVHDPHGVAAVDDGDDLPAEGGGGALGVVAPGDDAVEELAALAELHDEVDGVAVLVGAAQLDDVAVAGEVVHDVDLAADVVEVVGAGELAGGDGLAGVASAGGLVGGEVGHPELPPPQLPPEGVGRTDVLHGPPQHPPHPILRRRLLGRLLGLVP